MAGAASAPNEPSAAADVRRTSASGSFNPSINAFTASWPPS